MDFSQNWQQSEPVSRTESSSPLSWEGELAAETVSRTSTLRKQPEDTFSERSAQLLKNERHFSRSSGTSAAGDGASASAPSRSPIPDRFSDRPSPPARQAPSPRDWQESQADDDYLQHDLLESFSSAPQPQSRKPQPYSPKPRAYSPPARHVSSASEAGISSRQTLNLSHGQDRRLVIGIDYGTTFTGVAWYLATDDTVDLNELALVRNWGRNMPNERKIPSVISYTISTSGSEARQFASDLTPDAKIMVHTKMELDFQQDKLSELESIIHSLEGMDFLSWENVKKWHGRPGFTWKSAEQIVTDYLRHIFEAFVVHMKRVYQDEAWRRLRDDIDVDIVITVPVDWSYKAKNSTYRAVTNAGFNKQFFRQLKHVYMMSEPEAAAAYAVRSLKEDEGDMEFLKKGESFILCDAGGGTVDVVSYRVERLDGKLELKQLGKPLSAKCGSIYIDLKFKEWLRQAIGPKEWAKLDRKSTTGRIDAQTTEGQAMRALMKSFDGHKKTYPENSEDVRIRLPEPLQDLNKGPVKSGLLVIPKAQMQKFFDHSINGTIQLILDLMVNAEKGTTGRRRIKNIILVGGFAESQFLQQELREAVKMRKIVVRRPQTSWEAVVKGAVLNGVENADDLLQLDACPKNYGIKLTEDFSEIKDRWNDNYVDSMTNGQTTRAQMHWLVLKGDLLDSKEDHPRTHKAPFTFTENGSRKFKFEVYEYDEDDDLPEDYASAADEMRPVISVVVDMSKIPLEHMKMSENKFGQPCFTANTDINLTYTANHQLELAMSFQRTTILKVRKDVRNTGDSSNWD